MTMLNQAIVSTVLTATLAISATAHATTYYVDKLLPGSDSNTGTSVSTPFLTISKCLATLVIRNTPGDACLVKNGTYAESLNVQATLRGTAAAPITLKNYPGHTPIIDCTGLGTNCIQFNLGISSPLSVISYFTFEGFEVKGATYAGIKFNNADHLVVRRNYIHNNGNTNGSQGMLGNSGYSNTIEGNIFRQNGAISSHLGHGIYFTGTNYTIINNIFDNNYGFGIQCRGAVFDTAKMVNSNYANCNSNLFANNTFAYSWNRAGMVLYNDGTGGTVTNNTVINNIFYQNSKNYTGSGSAISFSGSTSNNIVTNNVHYATPPGATKFWGAPTGTCTSCIIQNNNGDDLSMVNPNMTNAPADRPSSPDFRLTTGSTISIDRGADLSSSAVRLDFTGRGRPIGYGYDIGAYEFSTGPALAPPRNLVVR